MKMGKAVNICCGFVRGLPVLFISAVIAWSYYAYVVNLCVCKYLVIVGL